MNPLGSTPAARPHVAAGSELEEVVQVLVVTLKVSIDDTAARPEPAMAVAPPMA
jgi:hypothetical protein